jgi:branched-chain amino acid transport system ATP-binding protein
MGGERANGAALLAAEGLVAGYLKRRVLFDVTVRVGQGEIVVVLGHNGAGKTTMLKSVFGLIPLEAGEVHFAGERADRRSYVENVKAGLSFVRSESPVFRDLTVRENLELGAFTIADDEVKAARRARVLDLFEILGEREHQAAGTLSGGEQRMLSLGISLMAGPKLVLLDEPSLGIAPALVDRIFDQIRSFSAEDGLSVFLVEQNVRAALRVADRAYFMRAGRIILEESGTEALARGHWWDLF